MGMNPTVLDPVGVGSHNDPRPTIISLRFSIPGTFDPPPPFFSNFMFSWHWPRIIYPKKQSYPLVGGGGGGVKFLFYFLAF